PIEDDDRRHHRRPRRSDASYDLLHANRPVPGFQHDLCIHLLLHSDRRRDAHHRYVRLSRPRPIPPPHPRTRTTPLSTPRPHVRSLRGGLTVLFITPSFFFLHGFLDKPVTRILNR